ncbi:antiterminator Q family protein, partial [Escherichia coli]|uniref:antiterminator Q family protein n=1 Tax=Escherichia coli TaxID=562 RepID=UPI0021C5B3D7
ADRNRSHWSTSKTPSYTKSVSWQHHRCSDGYIGKRLQKAEGIIEGMLMALDIRLEMNIVVNNSN